MQLFKKNSGTTPIIIPLGGFIPSNFIDRGEAVYHAEVESRRALDFLQHRDALQRQKTADAKFITALTGHTLPFTSGKIGPDPSAKGMMNLCGLGKEWPSLHRDFGVNYEVDASSLSHKEYMIDYEQEIPNYFGSLDRHNSDFQTFGQHVQKLQSAFWDMKEIEDSIYDKKKNPHPTNALGFKKSCNWDEIRATFRNQMRLVFQYYYNKAADDAGAYMRIRFVYKHEVLGGRKTLDQLLVFTFPTSEQEREAYRHVYWGEPYPEASFNNTPESRWLQEYHANNNKTKVVPSEQLRNRFDFQSRSNK